MKIGGKPTDVSFIGLRGWIRDLYASVQCCCFGAIVEEIFKGSDPVDPSQIPSSLRKRSKSIIAIFQFLFSHRVTPLIIKTLLRSIHIAPHINTGIMVRPTVNRDFKVAVIDVINVAGYNLGNNLFGNKSPKTVIGIRSFKDIGIRKQILNMFLEACPHDESILFRVMLYYRNKTFIRKDPHKYNFTTILPDVNT